MNCNDRRIDSTSSSLEASASRRCFRPSGGATSSSSESPRPASLAMESPTWVWALTKAGQITSVEAVEDS
jgi:hypothetical protein